MRKALIIGIDFYSKISPLHGCVNDAHSVEGILRRHSDGSVNFGTRLLTATDAFSAITRSSLKTEIEGLFADNVDIALLYFAGHGYVDASGGYLCDSDCAKGGDGLTLAEVIVLANQSKAQNKIVILDSCYSGMAGTAPLSGASELRDGLTILTASTENQYASESNSNGVFTTLLVDALNGAAANLVGDITPGGVYAHIDQSLGPWAQRPVFKTNITKFVCLRKAQPPIPLVDLQKIITFFPASVSEFQLDPSYEPERSGEEAPETPPPDAANNEKFSILQKYNRINLVVPVDAPHMWHAAMYSKKCKLTVLGEHYRRLVADGRI